MNYDRIAIYLNDHLAAVSGEIELADRCLGSNKNEPWAAQLRIWKTDIAKQRDALKLLLKTLNRREDRVKQKFAWLAEKAGRLKLNDALFEYSPLSRLIELEVLLIAAKTRQTMWSSLEKFAPQTPIDGAIEYAAFRDQAAAQVTAMEPLCEASLMDAFAEKQRK